MPKIIIPSTLNEHIISTWLYESGYKRGDLPRLLRVAPDRVHMVMKNPSPYLTIDQYQVIANATGRKLTDILNAVIFNNKQPPNVPNLWHDEQADYKKV